MCSLVSLEKRLQDTSEHQVNLGQNAVQATPPFDKDALKNIKVTIHQQSEMKGTLKKKVGTTLSAKSS